jgi:signal transduction histidine kinase
MSLKIDVAWLQKHMASTAPIMQKKLAGMLRMIDQIADTIQHISQELRPSVLDALGLPEALEWQLSELKKRTGQRINLRILPENLVLDKETSTNLFRIIQEAVRNVARHAQATELSVSLEIKDDIVLAEVHDNGVGIPEETLHNIHAFGLSQMRERAESMGGKLTITSRPGYGTTVQLALPLRPIYEEEVPLS